MKFSQFVSELRHFNPQLTQSQALTVWNAFLPFPIQAAIEERIAPIKIRSINLKGDPYGGESRTRSQAQHWVAYQASSYPTDIAPSLLPGQQFMQPRTLEFQHFVEVEDLRRDWERALLLHELIKSLLVGFMPCEIEGVRSALRLVSDALVSARSENETVYRYRATYQIDCYWKPTAIPGLIAYDPTNPNDPNNPNLFTPKGVSVGLFASPAEQVGEPEFSTKFADLIEGVDSGSSS